MWYNPGLIWHTASWDITLLTGCNSPTVHMCVLARITATLPGRWEWDESDDGRSSSTVSIPGWTWAVSEHAWRLSKVIKHLLRIRAGWDRGNLKSNYWISYCICMGHKWSHHWTIMRHFECLDTSLLRLSLLTDWLWSETFAVVGSNYCMYNYPSTVF